MSSESQPSPAPFPHPAGPAIRVRPPGVEGRLGYPTQAGPDFWEALFRRTRENVRKNGVRPPYG